MINILIIFDVLCRQNMFGHAYLHSLDHAINKMPLDACRDEAHLQQLLLGDTGAKAPPQLILRCEYYDFLVEFILHSHAHLISVSPRTNSFVFILHSYCSAPSSFTRSSFSLFHQSPLHSLFILTLASFFPLLILHSQSSVALSFVYSLFSLQHGSTLFHSPFLLQ